MIRRSMELLAASRVPDDATRSWRMLKVVLDLAPEPFAFAPLLIILLAAVVALVVVVFLLRYVRKGDK